MNELFGNDSEILNEIIGETIEDIQSNEFGLSLCLILFNLLYLMLNEADDKYIIYFNAAADLDENEHEKHLTDFLKEILMMYEKIEVKEKDKKTDLRNKLEEYENRII